jgi:microcin C transport system ATP-binding protein
LANLERDRQVANALEEVGLDAATRWRYPHEFSGGQRQRIAIARAMVLKPRFRDAGRADLGARYERSGAGGRSAARPPDTKHDLAYLFISHDLKVVRALANDVIVMRTGKVVEQGVADQIFDQPKTDYTKALMAAAFNLETADSGVVSE